MNGEQAPVALVTGAGRGIGAAVATQLAAAGYRVMLTARTLKDLVRVREAIESAGGTVATVTADVSDFEQVAGVVREMLARWGRVDVLINNAGIMEPIGRLAEIDSRDWARHFQINLNGVFNACRAVLPEYEHAGHGVIINISSGAASHPLPGWGAYCCSKAALTMLTAVLHEETSEKGVRVIGFRPGMVNTRMTREALRVKVNRLSELDPSGFLNPDEPARAIAWLCSEAAAFLAGRELDFNDPEFRRLAGAEGPRD